MRKESETVEENNLSKKPKKTSILIIVLLSIVVVAMGVIIFLLVNNQQKAANINKKSEKRDVLVTEDNVKQVQEELEKETPAPNYTVTMNHTWKFADGTAKSSNAYVANDSVNLYDVYFEVNLEDEENTLVYSSPIIPIGSELRNFALDKDLDAGSYSAIITYYLVDENQNEISNVSIRIQLVIES